MFSQSPTMEQLKYFFLTHPAIRFCLLLLAYAGAFLFMHPALWDGIHFLGWDAVDQAWPDLVWAYKTLAAGDLPLWNPNEKCGYSFIADPETGLLYPLNWLLYGIAALWGSGFGLILIKNIFHVAFGAVGMHFFLKRISLPTPACWTGTLCYMLSGRLARGMDQTPIYTVAWFPWMLLALDDVIKRPSRRSSLIFGVVCGMSLLSGYSPNFFRNVIAMIPVACVIGYEVLTSLKREEVRGYLVRLANAIGLTGLIFLGLALPSFIAMKELFPFSNRAVITVQETLGASFPPEHIFHTIVPHFFEVVPIFMYIGVLPFLFAIIGAVSRYQRQRVLWFSLTVIYFLFACGSNTFVLPTVIQALPFFKLFRIPDQYLYICIFFLCVLAAQGMSDLLRAVPARSRFLQLPTYIAFGQALLIALIALVAVKVKANIPVQQAFASMMAVVIVSIAGFFLIALLNAAPETKQKIGWLVIPMLLLDLGLQLKTEYNVVQPKPALAHDAKLAQLQGIRDNNRIVDLEFIRYRVGLRKKVRELSGRNTALVMERYRLFQSMALHNFNLLAAANVRYYAGVPQDVITQAGKRGKNIMPGIFEFLEYAPFAYWVGKPTVVKNDIEAMNKLRELKPGTAALVEANDIDTALRTRLEKMGALAINPVAAVLKRFNPNFLRVTVDAPNAGIVIINETFFPGWKATVDGIPTKIFRANYIFRGITVEPGHHMIEMRYRPPLIIAGLVVFSVTIVGLGFLPVGLWLKGRRRARRSEKNEIDAKINLEG